MKIETIFVLERLNTGNYCHLEMSASAKLEEGDDEVACIITLKGLINTALLAKSCVTQEIKAKVENVAEVRNTPAEIPAEVTVEAVKEKKTRTKKEKNEEITAKEVITEENILASGQAIPPVIEEVKAAVKYDRGMDAHKGMLSAHLTKNFTDWKTKQAKADIIAFNSSLHGKDFLDNSGNMLNSFKELLSGFYA